MGVYILTTPARDGNEAVLWSGECSRPRARAKARRFAGREYGQLTVNLYQEYATGASSLVESSEGNDFPTEIVRVGQTIEG